MLNDLGINLKEIIFAMVNFLILVGVLGKLIYKPYLGALENRKKIIKDRFDKADAVNKRAEAKMIAYNRRIANADEEVREMIKAGKKKADEQAQIIINEAQEQAERIIANAERTAELERERAMDEMRREIASMALMAAEKIIDKEIQVVGQDAIVDEVIETARSTQWQN
ncbi:MAG: F0F1 ATP synthase subunit B [Bacillota bacterium]|nr:F0F1 ATP synthase subunit B [Bacillota bacterium]